MRQKLIYDYDNLSLMKKRRLRYKDLIGKRVRAKIGKYGRFREITGVVTDVGKMYIRILQDNGDAVWVWKPHHKGEEIEVLE